MKAKSLRVKILILTSLLLANLCGWASDFVPLFDGKTFEGWEGNTQTTWRIKDQAIVAGSLDRMHPHNEFLATIKEYSHFELHLQYAIEGAEGFVNGGVQIRTKRIPNHHEVTGYQADIGGGFDGFLYDESRRNKMLAQPTNALQYLALKPCGWNDYRIRCQGNRIQIWLNDVLTVDYTETDPAIPTQGIIALQIHGAGKTRIQYRNISLKELPPCSN